MILNDLGKIVETEWLKTLKIRPDMNLKLGEFVVMPNHFHGIIQIGKNQYNTSNNGRDAMHCVSTKKKEYQNLFGPQTKNLSSIIRGFKSSVTKQNRKIYPEFQWQPRFYDRIIRDKNEWYAVSNYIKNNPNNWENDELYL